MSILWSLFLSVAFAGTSNVVQAPHGLGQFHEEPTGYRPSLTGATKYIMSVEGADLIAHCMTEVAWMDMVRDRIASHKPSPTMGKTGPDDYPHVHFTLAYQTPHELGLNAKIYLFLPSSVVAQDVSQKILSFQYDASVNYDRDSCEAGLTNLTNAVVDTWMREYGFYNGSS